MQWGFFQLLLRLPLLTIHVIDLFCVVSDSPSSTCFSNQCTSGQRRGKKRGFKMSVEESITDSGRKVIYHV